MQDNQVNSPIAPPPSPTSVDTEKAEMEDPLETLKICYQITSLVGFATSIYGLSIAINFAARITQVPHSIPRFRRYPISITFLHVMLAFCGIFGMVAGRTKRLGLLRLNTFVAAFAIFCACTPLMMKFTINGQDKDVLLSTCVETRNSTIGISYWDPLDAYTNSTGHDWSLEAAEKWCQTHWGKDHYPKIIHFITTGFGFISYFFFVYSSYKGILRYQQCLRKEGRYSHLDENLQPQIYGQDKGGYKTR